MIGFPSRAETALVSAFAAGLAGASLLRPDPIPAAAICLICLALAASAFRRRHRPLAGAVLTCAAALSAALAGCLIGCLRLDAIDAAAFTAPAGSRVTLSGHLISPARHEEAGIRLHLSGPRGRVAVVVKDARALANLGDLRVGSGLRVTGRIERVPDHLRALLERQGIRRLLLAERIEPGPDRGGLAGILDRVRERAVAAMSAGMPRREAALAAGFVFGDDSRVDDATREDFRRSGLAHLLAASGSNVMLLILLATVPLALADVSLRGRVPWLVAVLCLYLPLSGAGPSIQRATVMGAVTLFALGLGGAAARLFALSAAASFTLLIDPRAIGDVGWQLSFAATAGIMLLARDLRRLLLTASPRDPGPGGGPLRLLADGAAVTVAATLATAPLVVVHFGALSVVSLSANLLALPAVAPVMWLGMAAGLIGQVTLLPMAVLNPLNAILIAYISEVAAAVAALPGAVAELDSPRGRLLVATGAALLVAATRALSRWALRSDALGRRRAILICLPVVILALVPTTAAIDPLGLFSVSPGPPEGLRLIALDVGQGDAILIQTESLNLLVDAGPPGAGLARDLRRRGIQRLDALFLTHNDRDHVGGLPELLARFPPARILHAAPLPAEVGEAPLADDGGLAGTIPSERLGAGRRWRLGETEIEVLWPPAGVAPDPSAPNSHSLVLLVERRGFKALLTGDAETESAVYSPGDIDLLKVAHHGSADGGLVRFLAAARPEIALISVGSDNRYGHPAPSTLDALTEAGVEVHRTDREGDLVVEVP